MRKISIVFLFVFLMARASEEHKNSSIEVWSRPILHDELIYEGSWFTCWHKKQTDLHYALVLNNKVHDNVKPELCYFFPITLEKKQELIERFKKPNTVYKVHSQDGSSYFCTIARYEWKPSVKLYSDYPPKEILDKRQRKQPEKRIGPLNHCQMCVVGLTLMIFIFMCRNSF